MGNCLIRRKFVKSSPVDTDFLIEPEEYLTVAGTPDSFGGVPQNVFDGNLENEWCGNEDSNVSAWVSGTFSERSLSRITVVADVGSVAGWAAPPFNVYGLKKDGTWENCQKNPLQECTYNTDILLNGNYYEGVKFQALRGFLHGSSTHNNYNTYIKEILVYARNKTGSFTVTPSYLTLRDNDPSGNIIISNIVGSDNIAVTTSRDDLATVTKTGNIVNVVSNGTVGKFNIDFIQDDTEIYFGAKRSVTVDCKGSIPEEAVVLTPYDGGFIESASSQYSATEGYGEMFKESPSHHWIPTDSNPTITYSFNDNYVRFSKVVVSLTNGGVNPLLTFSVEGRLENGTWEDCVADGANVQGYLTDTPMEIELSPEHSYNAIRISFTPGIYNSPASGRYSFVNNYTVYGFTD